MIATLCRVRDLALNWRTGTTSPIGRRRSGRELAKAAEEGLREWYLRQERELNRPGNIMGLFIAGIVVGAALVGIVWLTLSIIND